MDKNAQRQLKIKFGALKRNFKDYQSYSKETKILEDKLEELKANNEEEIKIKKMSEQVAETAQMVPNCKTRMENAMEDLQNFMSENEDNNELKETEDWKSSEQTLAEVKAFLETI